MKRIATAAAIIAVLILALGGFYVARNPERETLDDAARKTAPGRFVRLSDGVTHYAVDGPDSGRIIVLVHGFSVPLYIWDSTAIALAGAGYRVVRYDEYGRGWSDRPEVDYTADLYDRQFNELLDSLHITDRVDVGGVSMGGWVTATVTGRHPNRVRSLILVDPVAPASNPTTPTFSQRVLEWPLIGSYIWQTTAVPTMADGQASDFLVPSRFPDWADRYRSQVRYRGFGHALLSTRQVQSTVKLDSVYRTVANAGFPVLLLWGRSDHTVPFERNTAVLAAIPHAEFHPIDSAGHLQILERASFTDSLILAFLSRQPR
jgi:pimeloyl-ACP methyl ester carboxylesterase